MLSELEALLLNVHWSVELRRDQPARQAQRGTTLVTAVDTPRADYQPAAQVQPRLRLLSAGRQVVTRQPAATAAWAGPTAGHYNLDVALLLGNDPYSLPRQPSHRRGQGRPRRQAGVRVTAGRHEELPGARARHRHRLGNRNRHPPQPRHRAPMLGRLLPGDPRGAAAALGASVHPGTGDRTQPRRAAVWRGALRTRRSTAMARGPARPGRPATGGARPMTPFQQEQPCGHT